MKDWKIKGKEQSKDEGTATPHNITTQKTLEKEKKYEWNFLNKRTEKMGERHKFKSKDQFTHFFQIHFQSCN
jgi:hypothetical protein